MSENQGKPEKTGQKQADTQFKPGQSGNPAGRPKGARNKLSEQFIQDMLVSWEEGGIAAIRSMMDDKPAEYVKVVASLMPKEMNVNHTGLEDLSDEQLLSKLRALTAMAQPFLKHADESGTTPTAH